MRADTWPGVLAAIEGLLERRPPARTVRILSGVVCDAVLGGLGCDYERIAARFLLAGAGSPGADHRDCWNDLLTIAVELRDVLYREYDVRSDPAVQAEMERLRRDDPG